MTFKRVCLATAAIAFSAATVFAGPKEDAQAALNKVAESSGYSWSTTTEGGMGGGQTVEGKMLKDGVSQISATMRDEPVEVFVHGEKVVVKTDDGWKTTDEIMQNSEPGQPNPGMMAARMARGFRPPVAQALAMLEKSSDVKEADGALVGEITGDDAKPFMQMRGGRGGGEGRPPRDGAGPRGENGGPGGPQGSDRPAPPEIRDAKVVIKVWANDGVATKVQFQMTGVTTGRDGTDREIDRTGTTELKDVGSTTIDVPDDVKAKLE
jgi:hypothetical protein